MTIQLKNTDVVTILGMRGTGKSTLARLIGARTRHLVVYDPNGEHRRIGTLTDQAAIIADRTVIQPKVDSEEFFEKVCAAVWKKGNCLFIVDEADSHEDTHNLTPNFSAILRRGRHRGVGLVCLSRRPQNLNTTIGALSHHIFSFRLVHHYDVDYLREFMENSAVGRVKTLPNYYYLHWDSQANKVSFGRTMKFD